MQQCEECGFEYDLATSDAAGHSIVEGTVELGALMVAAGAPQRRVRSEVWSPLEYACHVRDVLLVQRERVLAARRRERPSFEPMGRDERVEHDGYADQVPTDVVRQLTDAAQMFANVLARLSRDDWERTVVYNYPEREERSLHWVAVHTVHEVRHHTLDVRRQAGDD
jgi:hypothetical protein